MFVFDLFLLYLSLSNNNLSFYTPQNKNNETFHWNIFTNFKEKYEKKYNSFEEFSKRYFIFKNNIENILQHNKNPQNTFSMDINQFTDLSQEEFKEMYVGFNSCFKNL